MITVDQVDKPQYTTIIINTIIIHLYVSPLGKKANNYNCYNEQNIGT